MALDVPTERQAIEMVDSVVDMIGAVKIGLELFVSCGPTIVRRIMDLGLHVFLDGKFFDIPATVAGAARAARELNVWMFTVHCLGGGKMMRAAANAAHESLIGKPQPLVLGVTMLTSLGPEEAESELNIRVSLKDQVSHLARSALDNGLDGVIASPNEAQTLRSILPQGALIVTPGIRPAWAPSHDQRRVATPRAAVQAGADFLVIGRPITDPPQRIGGPRRAAELIAAEIAEATP